MSAVATVTSPICIKAVAQRRALTESDLVAAWQEWRAAVRAHVAAKRAAGTPFFARPVTGGDEIEALGLALGTFTRVSRTRGAWTVAAGAHRDAMVVPEAA